MKKLIFVGLLGLTACSSTQVATRDKASAPGPNGAHFSDVFSATTFYKGNIHTHTDNTDGDSDPSVVLKWYKRHGYNFVAITDHDYLTKTPAGIEDNDFITINGVELTGTAGPDRHIPVHVNAICGKSKLVGVRAKKPVAEVLKDNIDRSKAEGAITLVNHPNFGWAFTLDDLLAQDGFQILEIASGHPEVHEKGDDSHPSEEEFWDTYLTKKHRIFGAAVDDSHHFKEFKAANANPGRGWIQVWAPSLTKEAVCDAIAQGHFYAAKGSKLSAVVLTPNSLEVGIEKFRSSIDHVDFIGAGGQLLDRVMTNPARYTLKGGEGYVRAHIVQPPAPDGSDSEVTREAWTQPYFVKYE